MNALYAQRKENKVWYSFSRENHQGKFQKCFKQYIHWFYTVHKHNCITKGASKWLEQIKSVRRIMLLYMIFTAAHVNVQIAASNLYQTIAFATLYQLHGCGMGIRGIE